MSSQDIELEQALFSKNYADGLDEDELKKIGETCRTGFEQDLQTRSEWERSIDTWTKLAKQVQETRSFPWPNASNVKYPLISTASMQFSARAYPALVPSSGEIVKATVVGKDPQGTKLEQASRVASYMSYQILHEIVGWEEDMDKMLIMLPVVGCMFKKTWYDKASDSIRSEVILPKNFVVNYWTKSLERVERTSEIIPMSKRILKERQNQKIFLDVDLGTPRVPEGEDHGVYTDDETIPYQLIEQHTFLDLDDDDYPEPYIVTFERYSGEVLRIQARWLPENMEVEDNKIIKIVPLQHYTKFPFVPSPDGGFYDIGFGVLLGPLNESVNTLINQLIDAGTLNNLQGGFIGKGLRLRAGEQSFRPGEWKPVNATGDDLRKQIVPLPSKEPSPVLFQLMGTLITSGKELASVAEIFTGKMPGQNTPATTTMATVEQGMKVFTAVYKRIFRALSEEFKKIYKLNKTYLDPNKYVAVLDDTVGPEDFNGDTHDICPGADPEASTKTEKMQKAMGLVELLQAFGPMMNPVEVLSRVLQGQEQPNWQQILAPQVAQTGEAPPPPPDPKLMAIQAKAQADQQKAAVDIQSKQQKMELDTRDKTLQMQMKAAQAAQDMQIAEQQAKLKAASDLAMNHVFLAGAKSQAEQKLQHADQQHAQKLQQAKEAQSSSNKQTSSSGKGKK